MDPRNTRISIIDTSGAFVTSHRMAGGFVITPWPGGFDREGYFYNFVPDLENRRRFQIALVKYDTAMTPVDTLAVPEWQGPEHFFEHVSADGQSRMRTTVPYTPGLTWRLTATGDFWFAHTGPYELYYRAAAGDTLLEVTRPFDPQPVSEADKDSALARLEWFTRQGGRVDRSRIPDVRPAIQTIYVSHEGYVWVQPTRAPDDREPGTLFEVFDPSGRYLGQVRTPFSVSGSPYPVIRGHTFAAVTTDELGVQQVVRARIEGFRSPGP